MRLAGVCREPIAANRPLPQGSASNLRERPAGRDAAVGSFTLQVQRLKPVPVTAALPLLVSALAGFAVWRRRVAEKT